MIGWMSERMSERMYKEPSELTNGMIEYLRIWPPSLSFVLVIVTPFLSLFSVP